MKQDAYATQQFVNTENAWWSDQYLKTKKEPTTRSYTHSDNAYLQVGQVHELSIKKHTVVHILQCRRTAVFRVFKPVGT